MMSPYMLMGALMQETAEAARARRRRLVVSVALVVIGVAGLAVAAWISARAVVYGWQTADWGRLDSASSLAWPCLFLIMVAVMRVGIVPGRIPAGAAFRDAILSGDEFAPPASSQRISVMDGDLSGTTEAVFSTLRPPSTLDDVRTDGLSMQFGLVLMYLAEAGIRVPDALGARATWLSFDSPFSGILWPGFAVLLAGCLIVPVLWSGARRGRWIISADASLLSWRLSVRGSLRHEARWSAVRPVSRAAYTSVSGSPLTSYAVETDAGLLAWTLPLRARAAQAEESERLLRTIVTRTGLPLREVAPSLMASRRFKGDARALATQGKPPELAGTVVASRRLLWRRFWLMLLLVFLPIALVMGVLFSARHWVEPYQQSYLATYLQTVHGQPRVFSDTMAYDAGNWPVQSPTTGNDGAAEHFIGGAYQISVPGGGSPYSPWRTASTAMRRSR